MVAADYLLASNTGWLHICMALHGSEPSCKFNAFHEKMHLQLFAVPPTYASTPPAPALCVSKKAAWNLL